MSKEERFYEQIGVAMTCRSYDEYVRMFGLDESALADGPTLDAAAGASSFAASACGKGFDAYAVDPLYAMEPDEMEAHGRREIEISTAKLAGMTDMLSWEYYGSIGEHRARRERSLDLFMEHYRSADGKRRYLQGSLPMLPFADGTFALVLCSHFLFLYEEQFDYEFHLAAVTQMAKVCRPGGEVRLYPLANLRWKPYAHTERLLSDLQALGLHTELREAQLPFIPESSQMLAVRA